MRAVFLLLSGAGRSPSPWGSNFTICAEAPIHNSFYFSSLCVLISLLFLFHCTSRACIWDVNSSSRNIFIYWIACVLLFVQQTSQKTQERNKKLQDSSEKRVTGEHLNKKTSQNEASNWTLNIALVRFFWAVVYFFLAIDSTRWWWWCWSAQIQQQLSAAERLPEPSCLVEDYYLTHTYTHRPTWLSLVPWILLILFITFLFPCRCCARPRDTSWNIYTQKKKSTESILMHNDLWHISKSLFSGLLSTKSQILIWIEPMRRGKKTCSEEAQQRGEMMMMTTIQSGRWNYIFM